MKRKQVQSFREKVGTNANLAKLTDDELMAVAGGAGLDSEDVKKQILTQLKGMGGSEQVAPGELPLIKQ
jgi:hypothetical protein